MIPPRGVKEKKDLALKKFGISSQAYLEKSLKG